MLRETERNAEIVGRVRNGEPQVCVARAYSLSQTRVRQILWRAEYEERRAGRHDLNEQVKETGKWLT